MAGSEGIVSHGVAKFDGMDFAYWKMCMEDYLYGKELDAPLGDKPENKADDEWKKLDRRVLGVIRPCLSRNVAANVAKETTTKGLMKALSELYEKPSANNKVHLMKKLFHLKMSDSTPIASHLNEFNSIINQLSTVSVEVEDEMQALILLASLPNSWEPMRAAVSNSAGSNKLKFSEIRERVLSEEVRKLDFNESTKGSALSVDRGRTCDRSLNKNRGRSKSRGGGKFKSGRTLECWGCGKTGHMKKHCKASKGHDNVGDVNVVDDYTDALILFVDCSLDYWILDSRASFHTTANSNIMLNYVTGDYGTVHLADGEPLKIEGMGDVNLKLSNGSTWKLTKVRHVPRLVKSLISVSQLDGDGYRTTFGEGNWKVARGAMTIARGQKMGTLYLTGGSHRTIATVQSSEKTELWHNRLGHMSEKGMKILVSNNSIPDLKSVDHHLCESCVLGKQKKVSFVKTRVKPKSERLELVHTDVWGPAPVGSVGGSLYYVTFIDDATRKVWVYFMKNKFEVFGIFKNWIAKVENETDLKLNV